MDAFSVSLILIVIYQGFFIFKLRRSARRDKESFFNNRLSEISDRKKIFEFAPDFYKKLYQECSRDELDKAIDRQIRAGKEIDVNALRDVFLQQAVS